MKYVEYTIRMNKKTSDKLVGMSEASGEDNELVYLEEMVVELIENPEKQPCHNRKPG